ncbi:MAG TPA: DUF3168 domain-containing protein, partial [Pirellulales bacterium]|nr:DUF3168 domain-containing protein [Pirellulales bacterium]
MSIERAIHEHWASYGPLAALVPPDRVYTGLPPIRDASRDPIAPPYVTVTSEGETGHTRTSSGTAILITRIRFAAYSRSYEEASQIADAIGDYFAGREFAWSRGRVLDVRPAGRNESEDPSDGVWRIAR